MIRSFLLIIQQKSQKELPMKIQKFIKVFVVLLFACMSSYVAAETQQHFKSSPTTNDGQHWRVGYYEGGPYSDYQKVLTATIKGLMAKGWIKNDQIPSLKGEQTVGLWQWLNTTMQSDYIEFVKDAHYSADWDDTARVNQKQQVIKRLKESNDIDLMIAMGTWAGQDLANNEHKTDTLVLSSSDPISSGIVKSLEDSGYKHIHATVDPDRYERQLRVFHDITGFRKLGVAFENSKNGRSYAAINVINSLSKELGFSVLPCHTKSDISDTRIAEQSVITCFQQLSQKVDAIYVTEQGGITEKSIPVLVRTANKHKIPTFSQSGAEEVKYGVLASLSQSNFKYFGKFHAETAAKIFNGAQPFELSQLFEEPPRMAVNLKTAEIIGFNPPILLLGASDEIYREIEQPK